MKIIFSVLIYLVFISSTYALPQCQGADSTRWDNCQGTQTFANGLKYVGEFRDGKWHGKGTATLANGNKYEVI